ncbi:MAG: hypothetical protein K2Y37_05745 [Pirellulales bacterium]|nr:hypothetical protein [Pirellulales bacterium]
MTRLSKRVPVAVVLGLTFVYVVDGRVASAQSRRSSRGVNSALYAGNPRTNTNPGASLLNQALYNRPTVSPYLNLTRPGGVITPNYQSLVRPQVDQMRVNRAQRQTTANLQREISSSRHQAVTPGQQIRGTGHATNYMSYSQYFNTITGS